MIAENLLNKSVDDLKHEIVGLRNAIEAREDAIVQLIAKCDIGDQVVVTDIRGKESVYVITDRRRGYTLGAVRYWGRLRALSKSPDINAAT